MIFIWKIPIHWNNCFSFPKKLKLWIFFLFTAIFQKRKIFLILRKRHNLNQLHDCPHYTLRQSPQRQPHTQAISFFPGCWAQLLPVVRLDFWQTCISLQRGCVAGVFFFCIWDKWCAIRYLEQKLCTSKHHTSHCRMLLTRWQPAYECQEFAVEFAVTWFGKYDFPCKYALASTSKKSQRSWDWKRNNKYFEKRKKVLFEEKCNFCTRSHFHPLATKCSVWLIIWWGHSTFQSCVVKSVTTSTKYLLAFVPRLQVWLCEPAVSESSEAIPLTTLQTGWGLDKYNCVFFLHGKEDNRRNNWTPSQPKKNHLYIGRLCPKHDTLFASPFPVSEGKTPEASRHGLVHCWDGPTFTPAILSA